MSREYDLCIICFRATAGGASKFSWLACADCRAVNDKLGRLGVKGFALGRHSFMNGIAVRGSAPPAVQREQLARLKAFSLGDDRLRSWEREEYPRLASAFDPDANNGDGATVYRNLGRVDKWGLDGSVAWRPTSNTLLYVFGSINKSEIKEDVQAGATTFLATAGKSESGSPNYSFGARGQVEFGGLQLGTQVKRTGKRWVDDVNTIRVPAYTLVDFDARYDIAEFPTGGNVAVQLNITNLFDQYYIGFFGGSLSGESFAQIGAPRAGSISLIIGY